MGHIYYFALLSVEKSVREERLACISKPIVIVYTLLGIVVGWVLFAVEDFGALGAYLKTMFSGAAMGQEMQVTLLAYLPLLLVCAVASTPLAAKLWARGKSSAWADGVALVLLSRRAPVLYGCIRGRQLQSISVFPVLRWTNETRKNGFWACSSL